MIHLSYIRQKYGEGFVTILPDGDQIPWRPLTVGEYLHYQDLLEKNTYPIGCIHDEIFKKCVLNKFLVEHLADQKAGVVTTVATSILDYCAPKSIDELNIFLNIGRARASNLFSQIIVNICWAFPSYTPDDLYNMDYFTVMDRLALAEQKLAKLGLITEPLNFFSNDPQPEEASKEPPSKKVQKDLLAEYHKQQGIQENPNLEAKKTAVKERKQKPVTDKQTIITTTDIKEAKLAYTGHELEDQALLEYQMVEQTAWVYKDYLDQLQKDGKITIKSHEERKAEAEKRAKLNEEKVLALQAARTQQEKKKIEEMKKQNESKREFKRNSKKRRR